MRGGKRSGAGRPKGTRTKTITIKIQPDTQYMIEGIKNKSAYIDWLIRKDLAKKQYGLNLTDPKPE